MEFLHDVGTITWFNDSKASLNSLVVLDSQWLADVMSSIISFKHSWVKKGSIATSNLLHIWKGKFSETMFEPLKQLLFKFEIAFPVRHILQCSCKLTIGTRQ